MKIEVFDNFKKVSAEDGMYLYDGENFSKELYMPLTQNQTDRWAEVSDAFKRNVVHDDEPKDELSEAKETKVADIVRYDTSENVNAFSYCGVTLWIDKATRVGLVNAADAAIAVGKDAIEVGLDGVFVTLAPAELKGMLYQLEMYALDCFNVTERHKAEVAELTTIAEVDAYDITQGYPEKLAF